MVVVYSIAKAIGGELSELRRKATEEVEELLKTLPEVAPGLYKITDATRRAFPGLLASYCPVMGKIRVFMGNYGDKDALLKMTFGKLVHERYEEWFKNVNAGVPVVAEAELEDDETKGKPDIVYYLDDGAGVVEIKTANRLYPDKLERIEMQLAMYVKMIEEDGEKVKEGFIVTMWNVVPVNISDIRKLHQKADLALRELANPVFPDKPPNPSLCSNCSLTPICPSYQAAIKKMWGTALPIS